MSSAPSTDVEFENLHQKAHRLYLAGKFKEAVEKQVAVANHFSNNVERCLYHTKVMALYLFSLGDLKSAASILAGLAENHSDDVEVLENLGVIQRKLGKPREAIVNLQAAAKLTPDSVNIHDALAHAFGGLRDPENSRKHGERSLELKDAEAMADGTAFPLPEKPPAAFNYATPKRNVIAFSLFGSERKYLNGALANARLAPELYPGWTCRFYLDNSVPEEVRKALLAQRAEVVEMPTPIKFYEGLFWRFRVMNDPNVDRFLVRDADSVINIKERVAVDEWLASERYFHVMRDYYSHTEVILAGMWGGIGGVLPDLDGLVAKLQSTKGPTRTYDQLFLRKMVWPTVRQNVLIHDSYFRALGAKEYPPYGRLPPSQHVGQNRGR